MRRGWVYALCLLWLGEATVWADTGNHVVVVLDISKSMLRNDTGRLAVLSTLLLYDLANPNTTLGDSFEVIPFHPRWDWPGPAVKPPLDNGPSVKADSRRRVQFVQQITKLQYHADWTHFYPGLRAAVGKLQNTPGGNLDTRTVVLITDGLPDDRGPGTRDREIELIRQELLPTLQQHNIRVYVLAFGNEAYQNQDFFRAITDNDKLGKVFIDPTGDNLLTSMLKLFAFSFGYQVDPPQPLPIVSPLDLEQGSLTSEVAVVVLAKPKSSKAPTLNLLPPPGGKAISRDNLTRSAEESGASYTLRWLLSPGPGAYGIATDASQGAVAVVRPLPVRLEIKPTPPATTQTARTMANAPFPLLAVVSSPYGGDPGDVDIKFRTLGPRNGTEYQWEGSWQAPPAGGGQLTGAGRSYELQQLKFLDNQASLQQPYLGYLEVEARRGAKLIGWLSGAQAHPVEVYPWLALNPLPGTVDTGGTALQRGEQACGQFELRKEGYLPPRSDYPIRATLTAADPTVIQREFNKAAFTLDGLPLYFEKQPGSQPGGWYNGHALSVGGLVGQHRLCVKVGRPKAGDPANPVDLKVNFTLQLSPYDDFRVIKPVTFRVRLAEPPANPLLWLLTALALLLPAVLWYGRNRPTLPADLGYAIGRENNPVDLPVRPLDGGSWLRRLLGLTVEQPLLVEGSGQPLAWVRPVRQELYRLCLAMDCSIEALDGKEQPPRSSGNLVTIAVQRRYRLRSVSSGAYLLWLGY